MAKKIYPMFSSKKTKKIHGFTFKVYSFSEKFRVEVREGPSGCSATFLRNNARANQPKEFGLKVYRKFWDAVASYQRQKLTAKRNAAPPVGQLVMFCGKGSKKPYFGYETAVCDGLDSCIGYKRKIEAVLKKISIAGSSVNDLFNPTTGVKSKLIKAKKGGDYRLGGDLHDENVAKWKGKLVCIDFGHHAVLQAKEGYEPASQRW